MRIIALVLAVFLCSLSQAQFTPRERKGIFDGLMAGSLLDSDLSFSRKSGSYLFGLPLVTVGLEKPLDGAEATMALHAKADKALSGLIKVALEEGFGETVTSGTGTDNVPLGPSIQLPEDLRESVGNLVAAVSDANLATREALSKLTPEEKRVLIENLPLWTSTGTELKFEFVSKQKLSRTDFLALISKVELGRIRRASARLTSKIEDELPKLRGSALSGWTGNLTFTVNGVVVEISGVGNDTHKSSNTGLCIDLGGANRYTGRYGAGIGYASALIDFGSESSVESPDASCGVGILGIGVAYFLGPKPDFYGKNISFGVGLAGVGALSVEQTFRMDSRAISQGVGCFGLGILCASKGSDNLKLGYLGQGAAVGGGIGWLFNPAGNDRYRVGGIVIETDVNGTSLCRAQGYAGILPGGIGLISDNDGDDLYEIGSEGQAFAGTFGIGSLYDLKGNDTYIAQKRAQGSATNEGVAGFFDLEGDEICAVREGECHGFATGRSVSVLIDRSGNDLFTARQSEPASAQDGSFALFLDGGGADRYAGPVGVGVKSSNRFGLAMFIDLGGDDRYLDGLMSGTITVYGQSGIAASFDLSSPSSEVKPMAAGSVQATEAEIDGYWAQVCSDGPKSLASSRQLLGIGLPAFLRFCDKFADESNERAKRTAALILSQVGAAKNSLADKAAKGSSQTRAALIEVATYAKVGELRSLIGSALQSDVTRLQAVKYASALGAKEFIEPISALVLGGDAQTAQQSALALAVLGDEKLVSSMEALMNSNDLIIRHASIEFVAKFPRGYELGKTLLGRQDEKAQLTGIELLAESKDAEAVRLCGAGLNSPFTVVRIRALAVLNGRVPEVYKKRVIELMSDSNPIVSAVAKGIDLGR